MQLWGALAACALVSLATSSSSSAAEPVRRISIVTVPANLGERVAAQIDHDLGEWASGEARLSLVEIDSAAREPEALKARGLLEKAAHDYDSTELEAAIGKSALAISAFEASDLSRGIDGLQNAMAVHALALLAAGKKAEAGSTIAGIVTLRAGYKLDPARLSKGAVRLLEDARAAGNAAQPSVVDIASSPGPAAAYLDGTFLGITPVKASSVRPGNHYVTLIAKGYEIAQQKVLVGPAANVSLVLKPTPRGLEFFALLAGLRAALSAGAGHEAKAAALARWAGVDEVLVLAPAQAQGAILSAFSASKDGRATAITQRSQAAGESTTTAAIALARAVLFSE